MMDLLREMMTLGLGRDEELGDGGGPRARRRGPGWRGVPKGHSGKLRHVIPNSEKGRK